LCSLRLFALKNLYSSVLLYDYAFGKAIAKIMDPEHKESKRNQKQSQEYKQVEKLARKAAPQPSIPLRASAHPSARAAVRRRYPRRFIDLEQVTHLDVTRVPTLPQRSQASPDPTSLTGAEVSPRRTDDLPTEHIFCNVEGNVTIDEIDTFPADVQAQLRPRSRRVTDELSFLPDLDTLPVSSFRGEQEEVSQQVGRRQWVATQLSTGIRRTVQPQDFVTWRGFDSVRWWLISPGRLELLLCLIGAFVLICVTSFFIVVIMVSLGLLKPSM
jgi:hypothetical protein